MSSPEILQNRSVPCNPFISIVHLRGTCPAQWAFINIITITIIIITITITNGDDDYHMLGLEENLEILSSLTLHMRKKKLSQILQ